LWRLLLATTVLAAIAGGLWWASQSPFFRIDTVTVQGAQTLDPEELAQISGLAGQNIFWPRLDEAKEKLLALQMVKDVSLSRRWPNGIHISVVERHPWGYWQIDDHRFVVDTDGVVMYRILPPDGAPVVFDLTGARGGGLEPGDRVDTDAVHLARRLIEAAPAYLGWAATGFEYRNEDGVTAILEAGPEGRTLRATFGDGRDLGYKLAVLSALLRRTQEAGHQVHSVDLRFGERVSFQ
jgi:cell division protein FtsQ